MNVIRDLELRSVSVRWEVSSAQELIVGMASFLNQASDEWNVTSVE